MWSVVGASGEGGCGRVRLDCVPLLVLCASLGKVGLIRSFFPQCVKTILLILYTFSAPSRSLPRLFWQYQCILLLGGR